MMQYQMSETLRLHHETVSSTIAEVAAEFPVDRTRTFLMAFSQSVALNYRFAFTYPNVLRGVVAVCGGIPGDWDDDKYQSSATDVLIVAGESDEFYPINRVRTFEAAIARRAHAVEFRAYPVGHVFPRAALPDINDWLTARL
jgi:phospholipase/carboxylesterase